MEGQGGGGRETGQEDPWASHFNIIYYRLVCMCGSTKYLWLLCKVKKNDIPYPISIILITNRHIWYVCIGLQTHLIKTAILHNIQLIGLPWQPYIRLILMEKMRKTVFPHSSTILITEGQMWHVCVGLQLSSKLPFFLIIS